MDMENVDPGLYGLWDESGYRGGGQGDAALFGEACRALLEIKSAEAAASGVDMNALLNAVTGEMKEQLALFKSLRKQSQAALADPDADQKLARADLKAATDAISLIVRTLDKTDELQRKLNDARDAEAEANLGTADLDAICQGLNRHIEARAAGIAAASAGHREAEAPAARNEAGSG